MDGTDRRATAQANPNIAFIKYWGNEQDHLRLPLNPSLSMNLKELYAKTTTTWVEDDASRGDQLTINGETIQGSALERVISFLDEVRSRYHVNARAQVDSVTNFPMGAGIASSAAAFAALAHSATAALGLMLDVRELSSLARLGSGSASRSIPEGFVKWHKGDDHASSFAETIAPADHWNLVDLIAIVDHTHKPVGSSQGHGLAASSPLQDARVRGSRSRLEQCEDALLQRDFKSFAHVVELDSNIMHAVMMTSEPALFYWEPASLQIMKSVPKWRDTGLAVCYTLDAGPNVHCLCLASDVDQVQEKLQSIEGVTSIIRATPGFGTRLVNDINI